MGILEDCINPDCAYGLDFDAYALGNCSLSSGSCPICNGATILFCPACGRLQPTRYFIRNLYACSRCDGKLSEISKHRNTILVEECEQRKALPLGPREMQVMKLLAEGQSNKEISSALSLSVRTVDSYRNRIMLKTNSHSIVGVVHYAIAYGYLSKEQIIELLMPTSTQNCSCRRQRVVLLSSPKSTDLPSSDIR
jgi:DNA-binding CsgD family transcriptional regulator